MYYITISNGLLEDDHQKKMGAAVWQFMWLIDKVTKIDEDGTGWVLGGKPINLKDISLGCTKFTTSRNLQKLEKEGYVCLTHTPYGIIIKVIKAKKTFGKRIDENSNPRNENSNPLHKNVNPNKTLQLDNNNKTITAFTFENLQKHILWTKILEKFPDRDYEYQFNLMLDWWKNKGKKLPKNISAFTNWLKNTKPDDAIIMRRRRELEIEAQKKRDFEIANRKPANLEALAALRAKMQNIGKKM